MEFQDIVNHLIPDFVVMPRETYIPMAAYIQNDLKTGKIYKKGEKETTNNATSAKLKNVSLYPTFVLACFSSSSK